LRKRNDLFGLGELGRSMAAARGGGPGGRVSPAELEHVMDATRLVGGLIAESLAGLSPALTVPQWRVLVLASDGDCNVSAVADDLGVHRSNATRVCDRLVAAGLLRRRRAEDDRRHVLLSLTPAGRRLFARAMDFRRARVREAMALMDAHERAALARSCSRLVEAATELRAAKAVTGS
jgi:DNA-binding MarR family transcriptional regulator